METMKKLLVIVAALAIMQMIHFGIPKQASASFIPPQNISIISTIPFSLDFINLYPAANIDAPIIFEVSTALGPDGSNWLGVTPVPHPIPHGDGDFILALTDAGVSMPGTFEALGYTVPPHPIPHGDELTYLGWASNAIVVNGTFDLSGVSLNTDNYSFLKPGEALAIFGTTAGFTNLNSVNLTGANAGQFMVFDGPDVLDIARNPVPEPSTFVLLGSGLAGLAFAGIRRRRKAITN